MNENLEIEYKMLVSEQEFNQLRDLTGVDQVLVQSNVYYDCTPSSTLKDVYKRQIIVFLPPGHKLPRDRFVFRASGINPRPIGRSHIVALTVQRRWIDDSKQMIEQLLERDLIRIIDDPHAFRVPADLSLHLRVVWVFKTSLSISDACFLDAL